MPLPIRNQDGHVGFLITPQKNNTSSKDQFWQVLGLRMKLFWKKRSKMCIDQLEADAVLLDFEWL
jgi:hypothetical protein